MIRNCSPRHFGQMNRRGFLSVGVLAGAGLTLPQLLRCQSAYGDLKDYKNFEGTAKSIIHIFMPGGMAHQESFDPKPYAPIEYRGEMGQVQTKISGEVFGDTLPRTAGIADKLTIVRSMTHEYPIHCCAYVMTGMPVYSIPLETSPRDPQHWPFMGSVVDYLDRQRTGEASPSMPRSMSSRLMRRWEPSLVLSLKLVTLWKVRKGRGISRTKRERERSVRE